jgi:hypothetical protein
LKELFSLRTGLAQENLNLLCDHHKLEYGDYYAASFRTCCNILNCHKKPVKSVLSTITIAHNQVNPKLIPGQKICYKCLNKINADCDYVESHKTISDNEFIPDIDRDIVRQLNASLEAVDVSPIKHNLDQNQLKRKIEMKGDAIKTKFLKIGSIEAEMGISKEMQTIAASATTFIAQLKNKFITTENVADRINLLTLVPDHWTMQRTKAEFGATEYMVKQGRQLLKEKGVLGNMESRDKSTKLRISQERRDNVIQFYQTDEVSRIMPGKKDIVSILTDKGRVHMQKRLVLCNLKELYQKWKQEHPSEQFGFSTFAALRPKWCVLAGVSGTHTVCVCTYHQNPKLKVQTIDTKLSCSKLMEVAVCSIERKECMLHECTDCPGEAPLLEKLHQLLPGEDDDEIYYKQWVSTDRCTLQTVRETRAEFLEILSKDLYNLTLHHYISKAQAQAFSKSKKNLKANETIVQLDFSENFTCVVQDAVQASYFSGTQVTLHPYVAYYHENSEGKSQSYCIISNHMVHDSTAVAIFNDDIVSQLKNEIPGLTTVHYWSDGSAAQYKNR